MKVINLVDAYREIRKTTELICAPLEIEDYIVQPIEDVSPPKWHLGHTTWFFEQVILEKFVKSYQPYNDKYYFVFNSYYESFGNRLQRSKRGTISRPTVKEIYAYRKIIDERMLKLIESTDMQDTDKLRELIILGLNHEQQHQELLVTDIKYIYAVNPLHPIYTNYKKSTTSSQSVSPLKFIPFTGGLFSIGAENVHFAYDNEFPRHRVYMQDFMLADRLITNGEFLEFLNDNAYQQANLWLSDGWDIINNRNWVAPLHWIKHSGNWFTTGLNGLVPLKPDSPVTHVSYYEASAFARWAGCRLPTEFEWEHSSESLSEQENSVNFLDSGYYHPVKAVDSQNIKQMMGDVWEWTASAYLPYPGYEREQGALGEYNGKFMNNQMVLRGGSCATPKSHIRITYRNFFQCDKRWQFSGIRLAKDS